MCSSLPKPLCVPAPTKTEDLSHMVKGIVAALEENRSALRKLLESGNNFFSTDDERRNAFAYINYRMQHGITRPYNDKIPVVGDLLTAMYDIIWCRQTPLIREDMLHALKTFKRGDERIIVKFEEAYKEDMPLFLETEKLRDYHPNARSFNLLYYAIILRMGSKTVEFTPEEVEHCYNALNVVV